MVVTDTGPLNYLIVIGAQDVLAKLYREIRIPGAVRAELLHPNAPALVRAFIASPPSWLQIATVEATDISLAQLDAGEAEAILLAEQLQAGALVIDERAGAHAATKRGLHVTGTLGVLDEAARRGLVDLRVAIHALRQTTFRMSNRLEHLLLDNHERSDS